MIGVLNRLVEYVEDHLTEEIDIAGLATASARRSTTCGGCSRRWPACRCRSTSGGGA